MPARRTYAYVFLAVTAISLSALAEDGVLTGSVKTPDRTDGNVIVRVWQARVANEGLSLDGQSGCLRTELNDLSGSELTIEFWFKGGSMQSAVRQQNGVLEDFSEEWVGRSPRGMGDSSHTRGWVVAGWNGLHILSNDGLLNGIYYGAGVIDGEWHHVAMTWKQNTRNGFCSYVDGKLYAQRDSRDTPIGNYQRNVYLGAWNGSGERTKGMLDEVVIWRRALSAEEIGNQWNRKRSGMEEGVLGYWSFENASHVDVSTNQFGGTLVGGAAIVSAEIPGLGGTLQQTLPGPTGAFAFSNLVPGELYRVHAFLDQNGNGKWEEPETQVTRELSIGQATAIELDLSPPLPITASFWFRGLAGVAAIIAVGAVVRLLERRKLNRRLERLQREHQLEMERSRIARDIHDELGGKLARISYMTEACKRGATAENAQVLDALALSSRDVLRTLDSIVWAISPNYDSVENLVGYIGEYAREFFQMTEIDCNLDMPAQLPQLELTAPVRHHLFRVVQENLNNILKHSHATWVRLSFEMRGSELIIMIADNGCGFHAATSARPRRGNGLEMMRQRLSSIGGEIEIRTAASQGTTVKLAWAPGRERLGAEQNQQVAEC